jgi:hypothetical protein
MREMRQSGLSGELLIRNAESKAFTTRFGNYVNLGCPRAWLLFIASTLTAIAPSQRIDAMPTGFECGDRRSELFALQWRFYRTAGPKASRLLVASLGSVSPLVAVSSA